MDNLDSLFESIAALMAFANALDETAKAKEDAATAESGNPNTYIAMQMSTFFDRGYAAGLRNSAKQILGIISGKEPEKHDETVLN